MRWRILVIGKPKLGYAREGVAEYLGRLQAVQSVEISYLKAGAREEESASLLTRSVACWRIVLDERGAQVTSRELAAKVGEWESSRSKEIALLIGGAAGHTDELRAQAHWLWSLSRMTLQHELALVVALEQLYRAYAIKAGLPYHRD